MSATAHRPQSYAHRKLLAAVSYAQAIRLGLPVGSVEVSDRRKSTAAEAREMGLPKGKRVWVTTTSFLRYGAAPVCERCGFEGDATPGGVDRADDYRALQLDRIVPGADGGAYTESNCQLLCKPCNLRKSDGAPIDYRG